MKFFLSRLFLVGIFITILIGLISYARGYRLNLAKKTIASTGILVASSLPDGAKIYLDGQLAGATNSNLTLKPKKYQVDIKKDGYSSWKKNITIKGELVLKIDALLFPQNPSLSPITSLGVIKAQFSEIDSKTIILSETDDLEKDGIYLLENTKKTLSIFNPLKLLVLKSTLPENFDFKDAKIKFSPDGKEIILTTPTASYLISTEEETKQLFDITNTTEIIEQAWLNDEEKNTQKILETFKDPLPKIASDSFKIISFSPDESKILYEATKRAYLPLVINPPLIAANQTKEERILIKSNMYVYDKKEDKNFQIPISKPTSKFQLSSSILWYPDSQHLIINEKDKISIMDYDSGNKQTVYSGPFEQDFVAVTSDGKLLILANLNPQKNKFPDVYAVGIR
jgi:dipeptidyl aminopeptidase/acylaminoacyl peptidase